MSLCTLKLMERRKETGDVAVMHGWTDYHQSHQQ
jgi:predicted deacetylase